MLLKLKLQYFSHLMQRTDSFEKTVILGKIKDRRRREQQRMKWLDGHEFEQFQEMMKVREVWHAAVHGVAESQTRLSD